MTKRIRIVSDGTIVGTKVYIIGENGGVVADISGITRAVSWQCNAAGTLPEVTLSIMPGNVDLIGELEEMLQSAPQDISDNQLSKAR